MGDDDGGRVNDGAMNGAPSDDGGTRDGTERCANCGDCIAVDEWHPLDTDRDADGELVLVSFCTEACHEAWLRD